MVTHGFLHASGDMPLAQPLLGRKYERWHSLVFFPNSQSIPQVNSANKPRIFRLADAGFLTER